MEFLTNDKLLIVGAGGMIGSNMVQSALMLGLTPNICLYDIYEPGVHGVYDEMQQCVLAPDAEERVANLARRLGVAARIRITQRRQTDHLTFPYTKPVKQ